MRQFTEQELKLLKKELLFFVDPTRGILGVGVGDNCLYIYVRNEACKAEISREWRGCPLIPVVGEIKAYEI